MTFHLLNRPGYDLAQRKKKQQNGLKDSMHTAGGLFPYSVLIP